MREVLGDDLPAWVTYVIAFAVVTYLSVVLGELVPKALTLDRAEVLAAVVARPIELLAVALKPVVWLLQRSAGVLLRPFGIREVVAGESIRSSAELRALVEEVEGSGVLPRPGGAAAQHLRLRRPRSGRHHDPRAGCAVARWRPDAQGRARAGPREPAWAIPVAEENRSHLLGLVHVRDFSRAHRVKRR